jgi:ATP-dependent Zn protease
LEILKVHTRNKPFSDDVVLETLARRMIGMSGADIRDVANRAAIFATKASKSRVDKLDFDRACDVVWMGKEPETEPEKEQLKRAAYQESGHVLLACSMRYSRRVDSASIHFHRGRWWASRAMPEEGAVVTAGMLRE